MKKRFFTLIEVIVALGIASFLLAMLFSYLKETIYIKKEIELERVFTFSKAHVQTRLANLFAKAIPHSTFQTVEEDHSTLKFSFNNGHDFEEAFCYEVMAHLYKDQKKLMLKIQGKKNKVRRETLLEKVEKLSFTFAYATSQGTIEEKPVWNSNTLPLFFIMTIIFSDEREECFCFRLQSSNRLEYP